MLTEEQKRQLNLGIPQTSVTGQPDVAPTFSSTQTAINNTPITSESLTSQTPIDYKNPNVNYFAPASSVDATVQAQATQPAPIEQDISSLIKSITEGQTTATGKTTYQQEQEKALGVTDLTAKQEEIAGQILAIQERDKAIEGQLQEEAKGRGITVGGLAPRFSEAKRASAIEANLLSAQLLGTQGKLSAANARVKNAVAIKYGQQEEDIKTKLANLDLLLKDPRITIAEKNRASAQAIILKRQDEKIAQQKSDDTKIYNTLIKAVEGGADLAIQDAIKKAKTPEEALNLASPYLVKKPDVTATPGSRDKIFTEVTMPPQTRQDIIDTLTDKVGAKTLGRELTLLDLTKLFPDVESKTLQSLKDQFYDYGTLTADETKTTEKKWWQFWK